jgi:5'-nucleotidase
VRIAVDQDEVLADFVGAVLERWNRENGTAFTKEQINMWKMEDVLGPGADKIFHEWCDEVSFFENLTPVPGAIDGFNTLRKAGHDVIVVTSIVTDADNAYVGKRRWMRKYFPDYSVKNFMAVSRKGVVKADAILDDGEHNIQDFIDAGGRFPILFDAPWNRIKLREKWAGQISRVTGWKEALRAVEEANLELLEEEHQTVHGVYR